MKMQTKAGQLIHVILLTILFTLSGCSRATTNDSKSSSEAHDTTARIIGALANYKTFRMTSAQIHALITTECKRILFRVVDESTLAKYACNESSGIREIKIDSYESGQKNYLWYVVVFFDAQKFSSIRSDVQKRLGKPHRSGEDYSNWRYSTDKQLNAHGNPSIMLMLSDDGEDGIFQLGLEQGP